MHNSTIKTKGPNFDGQEASQSEEDDIASKTGGRSGLCLIEGVDVVV